MPSFKDIFLTQEEPQKKEVSAASAILASHNIKDKKFTLRVNMSTFSKFNKINKALGMSNGSVLNGFIVRYIQENDSILQRAEDLLQRDGEEDGDNEE